MTEFIRWAIHERLISIQQFQSWQALSPGVDFPSLLSSRLPDIDRDAWLDALVRLPGPTFVLPFRPKASRHEIKLDPFGDRELSSKTDSSILVPPHAWFHQHANSDGEWIRADLFSADDRTTGFEIHPDDIARMDPLPHLPGVFVLHETPLNIWALTSACGTPALAGRVLQARQRTPHLITIPDQWLPPCRGAVLSPHRENPESKTLPPQAPSWPLHKHANDLLDHLLGAAMERRASDIHLDSDNERLRIRFRIDGGLFEQPPLSLLHAEPLFRRIKVIGGMNPNLYGQIQDGAACLPFGHSGRHIRIALTINADRRESAAIRLFDAGIRSLKSMDLGKTVHDALEGWMAREGGLLLVSGPTGSGKTSTLHTVLESLADGKRAVVTLENPVERRLPGIRQIGVGSPGLPDFDEAMRSLLRQDPDVLMIGEIRDADSARIAVQAALSGHRVLSSLHAGSAAGVIDRLRGSFGIDSVALASALDLSIAQRLVPRLCPHCRQSRKLSPCEKQRHALPETIEDVFESPGCGACHGTGRAGRIAIAEVLRMNAKLEELILQNKTSREIRTLCLKPEESLQDAAIGLLAKGWIDLPAALAQTC